MSQSYYKATVDYSKLTWLFGMSCMFTIEGFKKFEINNVFINTITQKPVIKIYRVREYFKYHTFFITSYHCIPKMYEIINIYLSLSKNQNTIISFHCFTKFGQELILYLRLFYVYNNCTIFIYFLQWKKKSFSN